MELTSRSLPHIEFPGREEFLQRLGAVLFAILNTAGSRKIHTVRERLLALLAVFFAVAALTLAGVRLFGVLDYSVVQKRREIGLRIASAG